MMAVQIIKSKAPSEAYPDGKQHLENAALRSHTRKSFEKGKRHSRS
jgi:hypothetical protein